MFNRRLFVALAACLVVSVSPAFAGGGNGGAKKDSTIKVINKTLNTIYAFVDVSDSDITTAAAAADPISAFKGLGGKEIAAGGNSASFQVKVGSHTVSAVDIVAATAVGKKSVTTSKGKTSNVEFP